MSWFRSVFSAGALVVLGGVACVSPPKPNALPKLEVRFGQPAEPKPAAPAQPVEPPPSSPAAETLDPAPRRTRAFVRVSLQFESGSVVWLGSEAVVLQEETTAARRLGRFALVAESGGQLIERVRFDFPLLAQTGKDSEVLERGLRTKASVLFPDLEGEAGLVLVDEKKGTRQSIPWRGMSGSQADAPPVDGGASSSETSDKGETSSAPRSEAESK